MSTITAPTKTTAGCAGSRSSPLMAAPAPLQRTPGSPLLGPERYVTRLELAVLMGVSIDTVDRLVTDGMPSVT